MKKLIYILLLGMLSISCKKSETLSSAERNTVTNTATNPFKELLILINVKTNDSSYLVVKSIDSVNIFINNYYWTKINTETLDTSKVNKTLVGIKYQSPNKINYLIIANQDIKQAEYTTAGDFAKYLNASYELKPGEYVCLIESFQLTFNDNSTKKYYPLKYTTFKVIENSRSAYVGEIEIKID
jgi:hypothetical protein